ncbi:MAG: sugar ABC transporter permease [Treponema sp.]|jgi:multiple sugar transport system permease protein|nr:sugar ABC transporter permease [Treponema sp.]
MGSLMVSRHKSITIERRQLIWGLIFVSPAILGFLIFTLAPMVSSLILSLTNYRVVSRSTHFVGLDNYKRFFDGRDFFIKKSLLVTLYYALLSVPLSMLCAFLLATMLNRDIKGKAFFRAIYYLPSIVPVVATSLIWTWLLDPDLGLFNTILRQFNLPTSRFIYAEKTVIPSLSLMSVWTCGGTMVIFLAGLQGISRTLYEAVEVDGGNAWHKFWKITVPMMTPTIFYNLVMGVIGGLQIFTQSFIMTQGGPNNGSLFIVYYLYRKAFQDQEMGQACAVAWVVFIIIMLITLLIFRSSQRWVYYEGDN